MGYALRNGVLVPKRKLELPARLRDRRKLPDARFPHIWVPRLIPTRMAVAVDATGTLLHTVSPTSPINQTIGLTVTASANYLVIWIVFEAATPAPVLTTHWNGAGGQLMTAVGSINNATGFVTCTMYELKAPTSGLNNFTLSWTNTINEIYVFGQSYTGVDQTTPSNGLQTVSTTVAAGGTTALPAITSAVGNMVVACFGDDFSWATINQTSLFLNNGTGIAGAGNRAAGAASVTMSCTQTSGSTLNYAAMGFNINATAGGGDTLLGQDQKLIMM